MCASSLGNTDIIGLLLTYGADPMKKVRDDYFPLSVTLIGRAVESSYKLHLFDLFMQKMREKMKGISEFDDYFNNPLCNIMRFFRKAQKTQIPVLDEEEIFTGILERVNDLMGSYETEEVPPLLLDASRKAIDLNQSKYIRWVLEYFKKAIEEKKTKITQSQLQSYLDRTYNLAFNNKALYDLQQELLQFGVKEVSFEVSEQQYPTHTRMGQTSHSFLRSIGINPNSFKPSPTVTVEAEESKNEIVKIPTWFEGQLCYQKDTPTLKKIEFPGSPNSYLWIPLQLFEGEISDQEIISLSDKQVKFSNKLIKPLKGIIHKQKVSYSDEKPIELELTHELKTTKADRLILYRLASDNTRATLYIALIYVPKGLHRRRDVQKLLEKKALINLKPSLEEENRLKEEPSKNFKNLSYI